MASRPAPQDCAFCRKNRYESWMQHLGHLGFAAVAKKFGLKPEELYRVLLALYQDLFPENGAWRQYLERIAYERKLGVLPKKLTDLLTEDGDV